MTRTATETSAPSPAKVASASFIGTTIEWYDYYIFGTASVLIFNTQFFPNLDPFAGTLAAFATFAVAFIARPFGGAFFGHFGDRIGRKKMLVLSVVTMGAGTLVVGLLPTYATIGIWAPILLVLCRFLQGFAVGGEWGGAVLMSLEHAPENKRAFYASFPQAGVPAGTVLSAGTFALLTLMPAEDFQAWGWRIPFLASVILVAIGLYIRLRVTESPEFLAVKERNEVPKVPAVEIFKYHKWPLVAGMLCTFAPNIVFYIATVFLVSYGPAEVGVSGQTIFVALMIAACLQIVSMPFIATFADKYSKRGLLLVGCVIVAVGAFPIFMLFNIGTFWGVLGALVLALPIMHAFSYGAISGFTAELFPARVRYTGTSLAYQLGGIITSAPVPIIATLLIRETGTSASVSLYIIVAALLGFTIIALAPRRHRAISPQGTPEALVTSGT